ncbi:MAG: uncharacterized protein QG555_131, partial [Thermodesulfobacteriota bacterium]|nr:uncharacterized protein [Thermodesulfobacteriota bacterium]
KDNGKTNYHEDPLRIGRAHPDGGMRIHLTAVVHTEPHGKTGGETSTLTITVGPVSLPAAVDRPQLVLSVTPNQVAVDEFNRWASPLKGDIARVIAENL